MPTDPTLITLLPPDLVDLVHRHAGATTVQVRWRAYWRYGHARREVWPRVRDHLDSFGVWRALSVYSRVRLEWRQEPESWLHADATSLHDILVEARTTCVWGRECVATTAFLRRTSD